MNNKSSNRSESGAALLKAIFTLVVFIGLGAASVHFVFRAIVKTILKNPQVAATLNTQLAAWNCRLSWAAVEVDWGFVVRFIDIKLLSTRDQQEVMRAPVGQVDFRLGDLIKSIRTDELRGTFAVLLPTGPLEGKFQAKMRQYTPSVQANFKVEGLPLSLLWLRPSEMPLPPQCCKGQLAATGTLDWRGSEDGLQGQMALQFTDLKMNLEELGSARASFKPALAKLRFTSKDWGLEEVLVLKSAPSGAEIFLQKTIALDKKLRYQLIKSGN